MLDRRSRRFRFSLRSVLVLMLGIAIGYSLNLYTLQLLTGRYSYPTTLPPYVIEPPDVLEVQFMGNSAANPPGVAGQHLVGPDGRINLATCGQVYVAGLTLDRARDAIERHLMKFFDEPQITVDVFAYNSKKYYVIVQSAAGDNVQQYPITGNETVLDAIAHLGGIPSNTSPKISVLRRPESGVGREKEFVVDWAAITGGGSTATDYQLLPNDRLVIAQ